MFITCLVGYTFISLYMRSSNGAASTGLRYSFAVRTVSDWNKLPAVVVEQDTPRGGLLIILQDKTRCDM